ncbi:hypothetical protein C8J57DRAFT_1494600 [Mycena rebaudengoi]|nr:hypothetical protein C8J57DRAFT_1494600 [Mycena rebaudengoi]
MKASFNLIFLSSALVVALGTPLSNAGRDAKLSLDPHWVAPQPSVVQSEVFQGLKQRGAATPSHQLPEVTLLDVQRAGDRSARRPGVAQEETSRLLISDKPNFSGNNEPELDKYSSLYTPSEIRRNHLRKGMGLSPISPEAVRYSYNQPLVAENIVATHYSTPTGYIAVHLNGIEGPRLGYLTTNQVVEDLAAATKYAMVGDPATPPIQFDVVGLPLRLCAAAGLYGEHIGPGLKNAHNIRHTRMNINAGNPEAPDRWAQELHSFIQMAVFFLDSRSNEITVRWTNPGGDQPTTFVVKPQALNHIFYTGDVAAFESELGSGAELVVLKWVDL